MMTLLLMGPIWLALGGPAVAGPEFPPTRCLTPEFLPEVLAGPRVELPPPPPGATKALRDAYGVPNSLESENFVIRWGNNGGVQQSDVEDFIDAFELSWSVEVDEMDQPAPVTSDVYKFNVYVGDTGGGTPSAYGAGGYFTTDPDGYPMIVLASETVAQPSYGVTTAAHEFYHSVQHATGNFSYSGDAAWFWEATASWIEVEVYPDNPGYAWFLFGYAYLPFLPVNFFDYPDTGTIEEYHQYGAFIFPYYLSTFVGDWQIVRNAWVEPAGGTDDPLEAMRSEVAALGGDLDVVFTEFAAHNATWDYPDGAGYEAMLEYYSDWFSDDDYREVERVSASGTDGWTEVVPDLLPQRYGYNVIALRYPSDGDLTVRFEGDGDGSRGSGAEWGVILVRERDDGVTYETVPLQGTTGELQVASAGDDDALYLVVAAWSDNLKDGETFGYRFQMDLAESDTGGGGGDDTGGTPPDTTTDEGGDVAGICACTAGPRSAGWWALLAGLLGLVRRRRK